MHQIIMNESCSFYITDGMVVFFFAPDFVFFVLHVFSALFGEGWFMRANRGNTVSNLRVIHWIAPLGDPGDMTRCGKS